MRMPDNILTMNDILPILPAFQDSPLLIAGPCSAENESQMMETARRLQAVGVHVFRAGVWKPRTRPGGFEGYGVKALQWLSWIKAETGMLTATEVGCAEHARLAVEAGVDLLWIGARTSASPFAMQEIAETLRGTDKPVLVKNPVCPDLDLWIGAMERLYNCGIRRLGAIHRGFKTYGQSTYRNPPCWELVEEFHQELPEIPLICDPSHMGGSRALVAPLSLTALDKGYQGLIIESHCNPAAALTDAQQQITPDDLGRLIRKINLPQPIRI